jgi:hypothetical protein
MDTPAATVEQKSADSPASDPTDVHLLRLPHTGIQVPHRRLRVTDLKQVALTNGVAWTATLVLDARVVGQVENAGQYGETFFRPFARREFGEDELRAFAARCRSEDGEPANVEAVLEALVHEYEGEGVVRGYARRNQVPLRLLTTLPGSRTRYPGEFRGVPVLGDSSTRLGAARSAVRAIPTDRTGTWQIWAGQGWEDVFQTEGPAAGPGRHSVEATDGR